MKKDSHVVNSHLRQNAIMRRRRRYNHIHKVIRKRRNSMRAQRNSNKSIFSPYYNKDNRELTFEAPSYFSLLDNPESVIQFVNKVNNETKYNKIKKIKFELSGIKKIDNGAIGMLLTLVNTLSKKNIYCYGNSPNDKEAQNIFSNSGFLDHVQTIQGKRISARDRLLVEKGTSTFDSVSIGKVIQDIVSNLTGSHESYPPLYSMVIEIISNSVEHANYDAKDKNWLLSIHYEDEKIVLTLADLGLGILKTLKKKIDQKIKDGISSISNVQTLKNLFEKRYQSSTFDENRNKGLPKIKECFDNNYIDKLCVITNMAYLDFSGANTRDLKTNFHGTFYSMELTNENIQKWRQRTK